jgi:predicted methyltransferase
MAPRPILTKALAERLRHSAGACTLSLDLGRSEVTVQVDNEGWHHNGAHFPHADGLKERTLYVLEGGEWSAVATHGQQFIKLVPTDWGPPTFEIDGIKMLPTAQLSPWVDAANKVALVAPAGKRVLDTCAGLGYFAAHCLASGAAEVLSFEKNPDVLWLRDINPWSPRNDERLRLTLADVSEAITTLPDRHVDVILHDPPRFGIAGELYSQVFYDQLARVIRSRGRMFHYTGTPNKLTSGRNLPAEVAKRLEKAGFTARVEGDGVLGLRR